VLRTGLEPLNTGIIENTFCGVPSMKMLFSKSMFFDDVYHAFVLLRIFDVVMVLDLVVRNDVHLYQSICFSRKCIEIETDQK